MLFLSTYSFPFHFQLQGSSGLRLGPDRPFFRVRVQFWAGISPDTLSSTVATKSSRLPGQFIHACVQLGMGMEAPSRTVYGNLIG